MSVKLYSYWRSSCSYRVRIALALKGIKYEYSAVHLVNDGGEQRSEEYKAVNPMQQVPTLQIDGIMITQSMAIVEYIDEKYPMSGSRLFPTDVVLKTRVREICEMINSGIQPVQNLTVMQRLDQDKRQEWGKWCIHLGFVALERFLKGTSGKYCVGNDITAADAFLVPQIANANRFKVDMSEFPLINKVANNLKTVEAFIAAHPDKQPDCPDNSG